MAKTKAKAETEDRSSLHRQAYGAATRRLREAHRAEFNALMQEEAKGLGLDWKPKPTDAEKAAAQVAALLAAHPELREQMGLPEEGGLSAAYGGGSQPEGDDEPDSEES
jgi:hypothetical protein